MHPFIVTKAAENPMGINPDAHAQIQSVEDRGSPLLGASITSAPGYITVDVSHEGASTRSPSRSLEATPDPPLSPILESPSEISVKRSVQFQASVESSKPGFNSVETFEQHAVKKGRAVIRAYDGLLKLRRMAKRAASINPNIGIISTSDFRLRAKAIESLRDEERMLKLRKENAWKIYSEPIDFVRIILALIGIIFPVYGGRAKMFL
jgi:hypothetical protein